MHNRTWWLITLVGCTGPGPLDELDDAALAAAFETLHAQVYDVYALPLDADAVHDTLARSFTGEALTRQYVEHWTTRVRMADDGTAVDVRRISHDTTLVLARDGSAAEIDARWSVGGIVRHRSHSHARINRYEAVYGLTWTDAGARIAWTRMRRAERVGAVLDDGGSGWILDDLPSSDGGFLDAVDLLEGGLLDGVE
ncbi:MAG: hypothetical protein ACI8PZ_000343 [Myxococcota bacterium]